MAKPPEGPFRKKSFGGLDLPPTRAPEIKESRSISKSDVPVVEQDYLQEILLTIKASNDKVQRELAEISQERGRDLAWRADIEERITRLERGFLAYEGFTVEVRRVTIEVGRLSDQQGDLFKTIIKNTQDDVVTARDLGALKAELALMASKAAREVGDKAGGEAGNAAGTIAGHEAGRREARFWGALAGLFTLLALLFDKCGPSIMKAINATPDAPKIEQHK